MNIGRMDEYVNIETPGFADDAYGDDQTVTWSSYATKVPMGFEYPGRTSGTDEGFEAAQLVSVDTRIWTVRYDVGILTTMRLVYNSQNHYIVRMQEIGRRDGWRLTTEVRDNE